MLDGIRANSQSFWVKIAFFIIIVVFVFWGIGSYSGPKGLVASVNGKNITEAEFQRAYMHAEENIRRSMPSITSEQLDDLNLDQQVLQSLVRDKLIEDAADRAGITVTPEELRVMLGQYPFLQKDGKFDSETYREFLRKNGMTAQRFEADQARFMLPEKLRRLMTSGAFAGETAARETFDFIAERRKVDYILFPSKNYREKAVPGDQEIESAYKEQTAKYTVPPTVKLEYVRLDPQIMSDPDSVNEDTLKAAYEQRISQFTEPEKIHARHLLIRVGQNASQKDVEAAEKEIKGIEERIRGGQDFAEAAKVSGQDGTASQGGDLGWFTKEQMVPDFSKAAFALKDGEVSSPVRTQFGFHLIKKEGHQDAKVRSFDEVRDELRKTLATESMGKDIEEKADAVLAQALGGKSMAEAAAASGSAAVKAETSGNLSAEDVEKVLNIRSNDAQSIMMAQAGTVLDSAIPSGASLLVVKVLESNPQSVKPLADVRQEVAESLTSQKALDLAMDDARSSLASFKDGTPPQSLEVKTSEAFGRDGFILGLASDPALAQAAFSADSPDGTWFKMPFNGIDGAVLARLSAIEKPSDEEWKKAEPAMVSSLQEERSMVLFQTFIAQLGEKAKIKTYNSPYLNRKARQ